jgi:hypothetical protein
MIAMTNPLPTLQIDTVYKGVIAISAVVLITALAVSSTPVAIIALGFLFIGFGEWINHPMRSGYIPPSFANPAMTVTSTARSPSAFGCFVDGIGTLLIGLGVYRLLF